MDAEQTPVPAVEAQTPVVPQSPVKQKRQRAAPPSTPKRKNTKSQVRLNLAKSDAFNRKTKEIISNGQEIKGSNIDVILDHAYAANSSKHPKGSHEIASRMKHMGVTDLPNSAFQSLITKSTPPARSRQKWKGF